MKDQKKIKGSTKLLIANLDILLVLALRYNISHMKLLHSDPHTHRNYNPNCPLSLQLQTQVLKTVEYTS